MGVRVNSNKRTLKNVYRTYIDVVTYVTNDNKRFEVGNQDLNENAANRAAAGGADNMEMKDEVEGNAAQAEDAGQNNNLLAEMGLEEDAVQFTE